MYIFFMGTVVLNVIAPIFNEYHSKKMKFMLWKLVYFQFILMSIKS